MRLGYHLMGLLAHGGYTNAVPKPESALHAAVQGHVRASVGAENVGHRAGFAQGRLPRAGAILQKAADFRVSAPSVISVEETAFLTVW
ncbi:MAG: hypothetical protein ACPLRM_07275, partial [Anaerolineae bacterium]